MDDKGVKQHSSIQRNVYEGKNIQKEASIDDKVTYNYLKARSANWVSTAETLIGVAYKLESEKFSEDQRFVDFNKAHVYYMLIGFALENYLKAAIIQKLLISGHSLEEDKLDESLRCHNISKLFSDSGLVAESKRYRSHLDYLSECAKWRGRYPLPTQAKDIGGSITYHPPHKGIDGIDLLEVVSETLRPIPIDVIHMFVDIARRNLEYIKGRGKEKTL